MVLMASKMVFGRTSKGEQIRIHTWSGVNPCTGADEVSARAEVYEEKNVRTGYAMISYRNGSTSEHMARVIKQACAKVEA